MSPAKRLRWTGFVALALALAGCSGSQSGPAEDLLALVATANGDQGFTYEVVPNGAE